MFPSRKKTPITISTIGPANEREYRGGLTGGAGGGACTVLAIFHLAVYFSRSLLRGVSGNRSRLRNGRTAQVATPFQQLHKTNYQQNHRPSAVPSRSMQVVKQRERTDSDQDHGASHASLATVSRGSSLGKQPHPQRDQEDGPNAIHFQEPDSQIVQQKEHSQPDQDQC